VTEHALNVLRGQQPHLARASVALRVVPGEFDLQWVGLISKAAQTQQALPCQLSDEQIRLNLAKLDQAMLTAQDHASALLTIAESPALKDALGLAQHLMSRLRLGWNASGLWSKEAVDHQDAGELEAIENELQFRLRSIQRAIMLRAGNLPDSDMHRLRLLCENLID